MNEQNRSVSDKVSYRDSRRAAFRVLQPGRTHALRRFLSLLVVGAAVWWVWNLLSGIFPPVARPMIAGQRRNKMNSDADRAIAVVGLGAVLPDAPNAPAYWQNIRNKRYSISEVPPDRWDIADYFDPDPSAPDKTYSKIGGWVRGFEYDWRRFRMPPKVAAAMDEGQQWAVTIAAEALQDYGYPDRPLNSERTAVILGNAMAGDQHYLTAIGFKAMASGWRCPRISTTGARSTTWPSRVAL